MSALKHKPALMIFDLDGTLAHTMPQLAVAVRQMCERLGFEKPSFAQVADYIGNGIPLLIARSLKQDVNAKAQDLDEALAKKAREIFNEVYFQGLDKNYELYPLVKEFLAYAKERGIKLAVLTNKAQSFAVPLLGYMGIASFFDLILGGEILKERKPDPTPVRFIMDKFNATPQDTVMVGDSVNDFLAGQNAGTCVVAFTFGYNRGLDVRDSKPDYVFDSYKQLLDLIQSLS